MPPGRARAEPLARHQADRRAGLRLDALNLFIAGGQTGFGAFIAVHLTSQAWTQADIGQALGVGTVVAMLSQVPAGAAVDAMRSKRLAVALGGGAVALSALLFAATSARLPVLLAEVLHGFASCMIGPAIAAMSLHLAGRAGLGERLGRNARFASIGSAVSALALGGIGTWLSGPAVFAATAALMVAGLLTLLAPARPRPGDASTPWAASWAGHGTASSAGRAAAARAGPPWTAIPLGAGLPGAGLPGAEPPGAGPAGAGARVARAPAVPGQAPGEPRPGPLQLRALLHRPLLVFAACVAGFHLANAAMLPLVAGEVTRAAGPRANLIIAACIVAPQVLVALLSPTVGRLADHWGRRPVLLLGFAALPLRAVLLAANGGPAWVVGVQMLDGVSAAAFGVMVPLVAADLTGAGTRLRGRFSGVLGLLGLAAGAGATLSTGLAGLAADRYGLSTALLVLAGTGAVAALGLLALPDTRGTAAASA